MKNLREFVSKHRKVLLICFVIIVIVGFCAGVDHVI